MPFAGPPWTPPPQPSLGHEILLGTSDAIFLRHSEVGHEGHSTWEILQDTAYKNYSIQVHTRHTRVRENYRILYRFFIDSILLGLWETLETLRETLYS